MTEFHIRSSSSQQTGSPAHIAFVGRQREMGDLKAALDETLAHRTQLVMLVGEAGIGKTRTARELAGVAEGRGLRVLWGRCQQDQGAPPYWPWTLVIRSYLQSQEPEELAAQMGAGAPDIAQVIPEVRDRLPNLEPSPHLDNPDHARFRLFDAITTFFRRASLRQPLMLVLDNLHWADRPSLLLLEFLSREVTDSPLLLLGTYRDTELTRRHPLTLTLGELNREPWFQRMALRGLSQDEVNSYIQIIAGCAPPVELAKAVHSQTEGNPLFMTQVVKLLVQEGDLLPDTNPGSRGWDIRIPAGVHEAIGRQLDRLSDGCQQMLALASVVGREFDLRVLERLEGAASEDALLELLEEAMAAHVIEEAPQAVGRYQFTHVLIQNSLAREMSATRRARLHLRIGQALEELNADNLPAHASRLAHHFSQAAAVGGLEKLVRYCLLAGERSLATYAWEEALSHFQEGLEAKGVALTGSEPAPDAEAAALLFGMGRARKATLAPYEAREVIDTLGRAFEYYVNAGAVSGAVAVAQLDFRPEVAPLVHAAQFIPRGLALVSEGSHEAGRLLIRHGYHLGRISSDYQRAQEAFSKALSIARREGDVSLEACALSDAASLDSTHQRQQEAAAKSVQAIALARQIGELHTEVEAQHTAAISFRIMGNPSSARDHAQSMLGSAQSLGIRDRTISALMYNLMLSLLEGQWTEARRYSDLSLELAPKDLRLLSLRCLLECNVGDFHHGEPYLGRLLGSVPSVPLGLLPPFMFTAVNMAVVGRITGKPEVVDVARTSAELLLGSQTTPPLSATWARTGLALLGDCDRDPATAQAHYAALGAVRSSMVLGSPAGDRVLGLLSTAMGDLDQAMTHFEDSLAFCRRAGYRPELAWTCYDYAEVLLQRNAKGDKARAQTLLEEALAIARGLGMGPLVQRLAGRAAQGESRQNPHYPDGLTQRELEVLQAIAAGKSNREIAQELVLSVRTVERHITNIYTKISARGRADATSYALSRGLVR
jgi:DNA-binding CsgD family transcriptional regulator